MTVHPLHYARRWKTLAVLSMSLLIIGLDNTILNVALPSLQEEFDASSSTLQWIVDSYLLVFAGLLLTMGTLGDRFGRKLALQAGLVLFGGASLAVLVVDSSAELIAVRAAMGLGGALIMPATLSIIANVFPKEERVRAIAIWSATASLGIGLGPLTGGLLLEWFDWAAVFLINVPICLVALALGTVLVPESRDPRPGRFDLLGVLYSAGALGTLVYGIIEAPELGWTDSLVLACFVAAVGLGVGFVRHELRTADPMLDLSFFRDPRFSVASFGVGLASFALFGSIFALTQYLQDARGYSALQAGAAMLPIAFGLVAGAGTSMRMQKRTGPSRIASAGLAGLAVLLAASLLWTYTMPYWVVGGALFLIALCMGWIMAPATGSVMSAVPEDKSGVASAMNDVTRQVGGALGTAVIGSLITSLYASRIADSTGGLPTDAADAAEGSVGQAQFVADTLPEPDASVLADAASTAFTDALGIGFTVAAVAAAAAAVLVRRFLPDGDSAPAAPVVDRVPEAVL